MRHLLNPLDLSMDELDNILNLANDIKENPTKYAHTVSYTHLDVYKRQI